MCFCSMRLSTLAVSTWWSSLFLTAEWAAASLLLYSPSNCKPTASFFAAMMSCQAVACSCTACSPLIWARQAGREVDKVPLGKSWCGGQLPGSGEAAGHHGRSDGKPGEHDGSGGEELLDEDGLETP